ncbi:MAG: DUF3775 domain-containing protein [Alphaproteobacteria bacterium]|nr:DUF3775 domain-containing protein [Alphaproteobacteria bacterium]
MSDKSETELGISVEKVCDFITHVRAHDARLEEIDPEKTAEATGDKLDEDIEDGIETYHTDPVRDELMAFIGGLNEEEQINLVALAWMGRGDFVAVEWSKALDAARDARSDHTDTYLLGIPLLGDYLDDILLTQKKGDTLECLPFLCGTAFLHGAIPDDNNPPHRLCRQLVLPNSSSYILGLSPW